MVTLLFLCFFFSSDGKIKSLYMEPPPNIYPGIQIYIKLKVFATEIWALQHRNIFCTWIPFLIITDNLSQFKGSSALSQSDNCCPCWGSTLKINYECNVKAVKFVVSSIISMLKATKALQWSQPLRNDRYCYQPSL